MMLAEKTCGNVLVLPGLTRGLSMLGHHQDHKLNSQQTKGAFSVWVETVPAESAGPPEHRHHNEAEVFYVLEGEITFYDETGETRGPRGTLFYSPPGNWHGFRNDQKTPAQVLIFITPGGLEAYFQSCSAAGAISVPEALPIASADVEQALSLAPQYGLEFKLP